MCSNNAIRHGLLLVCVAVALPGAAAERMPQTGQLFDPKSPLVKGLYQAKAATPRALQREQIMLEMIGFREDARALGGFIERATLQQLLGESPVRAATVSEAIRTERAQGIALADLRSRVLKTALKVRIASDTTEVPKHFGSDLSRFRREGASAWRSVRSEHFEEYLAIPLTVTNTATQAFKDFGGSLELPGAGEPIRFSCSRSSWTSEWVQPGETAAGMCRTAAGKTMRPPDFVRAVAQASGRDLEIEMVELRFLAFTMRLGRVYWRDEMSDRAWALRRLRETSCLERGACFEDTRKWALSPWGLVTTSGLVAGVLAHWIAAWLMRRRPTVLAGIVLSIAAAPVLLGMLWLYLLRSLPSGHGLVVFVMLAICAWVAFLAGLWGTAVVARVWRKPQTTQPLST